MFYRSIFALAFSAILLTGCAETELASHWWKSWDNETQTASTSTTTVSRQQEGNFKVGNPYQAAGKWYTPNESYSYDETGIASWYGDEFHGKRTANGEIFDKNALTAAHPTLQIPSLIRVTNLDNGRSAVLRINDRGPFARSRLIDVSHQAANVLGFAAKGTAKVRVQVLDRESRIMAEAARKGYPPATQMAMAFSPETQVASANTASGVTATDLPPAPANVTSQDLQELNKELFRKFPVNPTNIYVQVGSFSNANNAYALKQKLGHLGSVNVYQTVVNGQPFNRVRIGPMSGVPEADKVLSRTISAGYQSARIVVD